MKKVITRAKPGISLVGNNVLFLDFRYFDRVRGIFRICFPHGEKPQVRDYGAAPRSRSPRLYLNPIDEWCTNIDYYMQILGILPFISGYFKSP